MEYSRKRRTGATPVTPLQVAKRFQYARNKYRPRRLTYGNKWVIPVVRGRIGRHPPLLDKGICDDDSQVKDVTYVRPWSDYLLMPELGQASNQRHAHVFKTWSLYMRGGLHIAANEGDVGDTVLSDVLFILDRNPTGSSVPSYSSIFMVRNFDSDVNCSLNDFVRTDVLSRFKILRRIRVELHTFEVFMKFKGRKSLYTTMRDDAGVTSGMYSNCKKNAILMYVVSHGQEQIKVEGEINVRRVYYH